MSDLVCSTWGSRGFDPSILGPNHCSFCDGTEGGNPPSVYDVLAEKYHVDRKVVKSLLFMYVYSGCRTPLEIMAFAARMFGNA